MRSPEPDAFELVLRQQISCRTVVDIVLLQGQENVNEGGILVF